MRAWTVLCALFTTLLIPSFTAAADESPKQKAGEWEIVQLGEHNLGSGFVGTECVGDQSVLAKINAMPDCSSRKSHTDGAITIADAKCRVLDSVMSIHQMIMERDDNNIYIYFHATFSPPFFLGTELEQTESILFTHLKRLGACRTGQMPLK